MRRCARVAVEEGNEMQVDGGVLSFRDEAAILADGGVSFSERGSVSAARLSVLCVRQVPPGRELHSETLEAAMSHVLHWLYVVLLCWSSLHDQLEVIFI